MLLLLVAATARAQVFIPDTLVRAWLNQSIPGIVDANGIMDTTHAGIAGCDSAMWYGSDNDPDTVQIDLEGVQYLHALTYLFVSYYSLNQNKYTIQSLPELPPALNRLDLSIHIGSGHVHLPVIDHPMDDINIQGGPMNRISVHFDAILDTLARIDIHAYDSISCDQFSGYVEDLNLHANDLSDDSTWISLTNWKCDWLYIDGNLLGTIFDLDECEANDLYITDCNVIVQSWPLGLTDLTIHGYTFHPIPSFPSTIQSMNLQVFPSICLPMLPEGLMSLSGSSGVNCIPNIPTSMQYMDGPFIWQNPGDTILCSILNSDCPGAAAAIAGRHAIDDNSNGQLDAGEPLFPWGRVLIQPMNALVPAGTDGWWERGAQPGTYTIEPNSTYPYLISSAPAQHSATFAALGEVDSTNHFAHILLPGVNDLQVDAFAPPPRPGFDNTLHLTYRNYGTTALPATLQLAVDADQTFVGSTPAPTTLVGNTATWDLGTLPLGASGQVAVTLHTDAAVPLGTPVQHTAVIDPVAGDTVPTNNTTLWTDTVVGAYDPNDKLLDIPAATPAEVQADAVTLTYTIRFQNTGTYPAERVLILDTLSDDLQWNSFEFLSSSHPCQWYMIDGVLHFLFDPILLPDSGSNEPASHGFVRFRMRPSTQLSDGDQVDNIAHIVFDFNSPIVTPPATFRVDMSTDVEHPAASAFTVVPNPTRDRLTIAGPNAVATARILDLSGRLLSTVRGGASPTIDVADLAPGTYILEVRSQDVVHAVRFVKE